MHVQKSNNCCGIVELVGINALNWNSRYGVQKVQAKYSNAYGLYDKFSVVLLTQMIAGKQVRYVKPEDYKKLLNFKRYIKMHDLGHLTIAEPVRNPNTGHVLVSSLWSVNVRNLKKFGKEPTKVTDKRIAERYA